MMMFLTWTIILHAFGSTMSALKEHHSSKGMCVNGWYLFANKCYKQEPVDRTWEDAHRFCKDQYGADLASVSTHQENTFIYNLIQSSKQNSWLGLHQHINISTIDHMRHNNSISKSNNKSTNINSTWLWTDGSNYNTFQNWMPGQHTKSSSSSNHNTYEINLCGEMLVLPVVSSMLSYILPSVTSSGHWNKKPCSTKQSFICKTKILRSSKTYEVHNSPDNYINHNKRKRLRKKRSDSNRFVFRDNPFFAAINDHASENYGVNINDIIESSQRLSDKKIDNFNDIHRFFHSWSPAKEPIKESDETHDAALDYDYDSLEYYDYYDSMYNDDSANVYHVTTVAPQNSKPKPYALKLREDHTSNPRLQIEEIISIVHKTLYNQENATEESVATTSNITAVCANGWTHSLDLQNCYKVFKHPLTWYRSEMSCKANGGHLVSIGSVLEENFIHNMLMTRSMPVLYNKIWIGLKRTCDENQSCEHEWTDGSNKTYMNWNTNDDQSDNETNIIENCVAASLVTMNLTEKKCHSFYPYVCKIPEGHLIPVMNPPTEAPMEYCEDGDISWLRHDGFCYKVVPAGMEEYSFWKSRKRCQEEGAELVSIHSIKENHFINSMIYKLSDISLWIGGEANIESGFHWVDNSSFSFFIWAPEEPNNNHEQESCITMYTSHNNGYWNDDNCARKMGRICKRPYGATFPPPPTTAAPSGHCPQSWNHIAGQCLQVFGGDNATGWSNARQQCKALAPGADLASLHNHREQAAITALVSAVGYNVWIGFLNTDGFHWADQSEVEFTHWAVGEPNGHKLRNSRREGCVEVIGTSHQQKGRWNDIYCSENLGYICQMQTDPNLLIHQLPQSCMGDFEQYFNYSGACYKPVTQHETWKDAEAKCISEGAHLASILDVAESSYIYLLAIEAGLSTMWLGLNSLQDSSGGNHQFSWSDGWAMLLSNWGSGQPNTSLTDNRCAHLNIHDGLWYTGKCASEMPYICKHKDSPIPTPDPPTRGHCPDGRWKDLGGSYCYLISKEHKPWNEALRDCLQEGLVNNTSNLISFHTQSELDLILQLTSHIIDPIWIGLTQFTNGFGWSDGTGLDFLNWNKYEPNNNEERCGELYTNNGKWNDAPCDNARPFICKMKKTVAIEPTITLLPENLPNFSSTGSLIGPGISAGIIVTVVFSVVFVLVVVGLMSYRYYIKPRPIHIAYSHAYRDGMLNPSSPQEAEDTTQIYEITDG